MVQCVHAGPDLVTFIIIAIIVGIIRSARKAATSATKDVSRPIPAPRAAREDDLEQFLKSIGTVRTPVQTPSVNPPVQRPPAIPVQKVQDHARTAATPHRLPLRWEDTALVRAVTSRLGGKHAAAPQAQPPPDSSRARMKARRQAEEQSQVMAQLPDTHSVFRPLDAQLPPLPLGASMPIMSLIDPISDPLRISHEDDGLAATQATAAFQLPDLSNQQTLRGTILAREILAAPVALRPPSSSRAAPIS